jgi:hypothetical protein
LNYSPSQLQSLRSMRKTGSKVMAVPTFPNDYTSGNWPWDVINQYMVWNNTDPSPMVCLLGTGVDDKNPDLAGKIVKGYDFVNQDTLPNDDSGAGTNMAGVIVGNLNNGAGTAAGISNGKVLAVKIANAQEAASLWNLSLGINYCAANSLVKVIDISAIIYWAPSTLYNALDNAINIKGKLVVAAAGNDSSSDYRFPAAWALENIEQDGSYNATASASDNYIHQGLISVASGRDPFDDASAVWVDEDGDGTDNSGEELFYGCASDNTDYGNWINMVAPGGDPQNPIWTTSPVSYPFWIGSTYGAPAKYANAWGTALASAYVAGAAARVWSLPENRGSKTIPAAAPDEIKDILMMSGYYLSDVSAFAVDGTDYSPDEIDPARGYFQENITYGWDEELGHSKGPFCWPDDTSPFEADQDMSNTVYLDVASAMLRGAIGARIWDATNGVPLANVTVKAINETTGKVTDTAKTNAYGDFTLINLPPDYYKVTYNLAKYTSGDVTVAYDVFVPPSYFGDDPGLWTGLAPLNNNITITAEWYHYWVDDQPANLDMAIWTPLIEGSGSNRAQHVVGAQVSNYAYSDADAPTMDHTLELGDGTLDPSFDIHAFRSRDGGLLYGDGNELETIVLAGKAAKTSPFLMPWYSSAADYPPDGASTNYTYTLLLWDYSNAGYGGSNPGTGVPKLVDSYPMVRVWAKGKIVKDVYLYYGDNCTGDVDFWRPLTILGTTYDDSVNQCGQRGLIPDPTS